MANTGRPHDFESDATELDRSPSYPPGSDATQLESPPSSRSGADATQYERPRTNPPGADATQLGYTPPPFANPFPPGYTANTPGYPPPVAADRPAYPAPPPAAPIGAFPPPVQPRPQRRRHLIVASSAALLVAIVVVAGILLVAMRGRGDTATASATPQPQPSTPNPTIPVVAVATPSVAATVPATVAPSTAPAQNAATDSWTDPERRVTVRFPADWKKNTFDSRDENSTIETAQPLVQVTGPDGVQFSVTIYRSVKTLEEDVRAFRDAAASDPKIAFRADETQDATIGGEPAKRLTGTYTQNGESLAVTVWFVDHDGKRFGFTADRIGTHRAEVDAIIASVTFVLAGPQIGTAVPTNAAVPTTRAQTALATTSSIFGTPTPPRPPAATRSP